MVSTELVSLTLIVAVGIAASWAAWRVDLPSILLLLVAGVLLGPVAGLVRPRQLFGPLLEPLVGVAVAVILFEGGLTLDLDELDTVGGAVRNLVTVGVLVTWVVGGLAAYVILGLPPGVSVLLGAILVVTGPTVVLPLLRQIRVEGDLANLLRWEGIVIDPVGVVLSVAVAEFLLAGGLAEATLTVVETVAIAVLGGAAIGLAGGLALERVVERHLLPDRLESPAALATLLAVFVACETLQPEAGLVGATVLGVTLANRSEVATRHVVEFQENLREVLLPFVFVLLAAALDPSSLSLLGPESAAFLAVLVLVARPLAVAASTVGSPLDPAERAFAAALAPRGIVAAALSSVLAFDLAAVGVPGAESLVPLTFFVIIATVALYGLAASPLARFLGIADPDPQGLLFVGAQRWVRGAASVLDEAGVTVRLVDTNEANVQAAQAAGLPAHAVSSTSGHVLDKVPLSGIGSVLAVTPNDEVNRLALIVYDEVVDRSHLYRLPPKPGPGDPSSGPGGGSQLLFHPGAHERALERRWGAGWRFRLVPADEAPPLPGPDEEAWTPGDEEPLPVVVLGPDGRVAPVTAPGVGPEVDPGGRVLVLAPPGGDETSP